MAKLLLTSDLHLGRQFPGLGRAGDIVRKALKESLEKSVTAALESSVDLFLVGGNLFASNLVSRNLIEYVYRQAERLGRIPFIVAPGQADCLDSNSVYRHLPLESRPDNFFIPGLTHETTLSFPDSEVTLYAIPDLGDSLPQAGWQTPVRTPHPGAHVLLIGNRAALEPHESAALSPLVNQSILKNSFDFYAVGGHAHYRQWATNAYSPGAPETLDFDSDQAGLSLLVEVNGDHVAVDAVPTGELAWKRLQLDSTQFLYNIEIERELQKFAGATKLLELRVGGNFVGDGYLDLAALERAQSDNFCFLRIRDDRQPAAAAAIVATDNGGSLIGEFTALMRDSIDKAPAELRAKYLEALSTGRALLSGKDVI